MRKLIYPINLSLDGCFDHTVTVIDVELLEYYTSLVRDAGQIVYGRKTYEIMVPYWPDIAKNPAGETKAEVDYAEAFDSVEKIVFSRTLDKVEGKNARLLRTNLEDEILKLKQAPGKYMLVGGVAIPSQLIAAGLVDEFIFVIQPVIAGAGKRLMEGIEMQKKLKLSLIASKTFGSGAMLLHYSAAAS